MLEIKNLHVFIEKKHVLKGVDLMVRPGEIHAIMGPNGSGKSTLAYALMGHPSYQLKVKSPAFAEATAGRRKLKVELDGKNLLGVTPDQRAKLGLFLAFQYPVSVEGISVGNFLRKVSEMDCGKSKVDAAAFQRRLRQKAQRLGLKDELLQRSLNEGFSGGEKKRMEILQMASLRPKYAILDETDSGLDIDALKKVASGVKKIIFDNKNIGIILITHYQRILRFIEPDFVHVMIDGKIVKSGGRELAMELEKKGYKNL